jgi:hypothetical protein
MGFIIGRGRYARETYPETGGSSDAAFARNSATGPSGLVPLDNGVDTYVPWHEVESVGIGTTIHVPITPKVTGKIRVIAMIGINNTTLDPATVDVRVAVGDGATPIPVPVPVAVATVDGTATPSIIEIPVLVDFDLPIGVTSNISIMATLTGTGVGAIGNFVTDLCSIDIEELSVSTG